MPQAEKSSYLFIGIFLIFMLAICVGSLWFVNWSDDVQKWATLINALIPLLGELAWPLIVLFALLYFGAPLKKFLTDIGEFSFRAGASGFEATAKRQQAANSSKNLILPNQLIMAKFLRLAGYIWSSS